MTVERVIVGISGASGAALGVRIVERLSALPDIETHLVVSDAARRTLALECGLDTPENLTSLVDRHHPIDDVGASIASGSFPVHGMIVAPCSMQTLSAIATGRADTLLTRAADVQLKERRRLVLLARETPLHLGHLRAMVSATEMGAIIMPPVPAFYHRPNSVAEIVDHLAARAIDLLALARPSLTRSWEGTGGA
ncbi:UbiX family flavin prenyltransferase [Shinella sp. CPCC 101442]|uniref:UbiX family flavin prenyltransferase n=1 Tax=Shinella sp. CPCC 101442 TaxID=2932265 RepID=UPI0021537141|nr:UbiX family flavin prenyltransferase [Shinella sp. CPCC 101442]MCR6497493.1 UbiX family flavin prenyltransferase [Shinella sp. CPCC 101442]